MAFEVRILDQGPVYGGGDPVVCHFDDDEWWNLLSLAHECGFDPEEEYLPLVYPEEVGEANELNDRTTGGLYIGVGVVLNQDTLPFATTWESDDGRLHFRWANPPAYSRNQRPQKSGGPGEGSEFSLEVADLRQLQEYLHKARMLAARVLVARVGPSETP